MTLIVLIALVALALVVRCNFFASSLWHTERARAAAREDAARYLRQDGGSPVSGATHPRVM